MDFDVVVKFILVSNCIQKKQTFTSTLIPTTSIVKIQEKKNKIFTEQCSWFWTIIAWFKMLEQWCPWKAPVKIHAPICCFFIIAKALFYSLFRSSFWFVNFCLCFVYRSHIQHYTEHTHAWKLKLLTFCLVAIKTPFGLQK